MEFNKALNEYGRQYNDIKDLARSGAEHVQIMKSSIMTDEGEKVSVIYDEKNSSKKKYQVTFVKKVGNDWERVGQPIQSNDYQDLLEKSVKAAESKKIKPAKFRTKFKSFLADYIGKPTRKLFK